MIQNNIAFNLRQIEAHVFSQLTIFRYTTIYHFGADNLRHGIAFFVSSDCNPLYRLDVFDFFAILYRCNINVLERVQAIIRVLYNEATDERLLV